jgi:hypothetical protein
MRSLAWDDDEVASQCTDGSDTSACDKSGQALLGLQQGLAKEVGQELRLVELRAVYVRIAETGQLECFTVSAQLMSLVMLTRWQKTSGQHGGMHKYDRRVRRRCFALSIVR